MRILTLVWSIGLGGTERAAVNYAIGYQRAGADSRVLVLGEGMERREELLSMNVQLWPLIETANREKILEEVKEWQPDIIHIHNFSEGLNEYIKLFKTGTNKVVHTNVFSRPFYSTSYAIVDASMQLTHWGLWKFQYSMSEEMKIPFCKIVPYISFADRFEKPIQAQIDDYRKELNIPENAFVIGRIGQPLMSKWDKRIISIIRKTVEENNDIYYLLAGLPTELKKEVLKEKGIIKSRVKMIDKISGDEKLSLYYHSIDLFAHLSKIGESFGYVLTEAMLCEVPVITMLTPFKDNGQFEVLGKGSEGNCVTNKKEFCNAIMQNYLNGRESISLRTNLRQSVIQRFSAEAVIPGLLQFYDQLLSDTASGEFYDKKLIVEQMNLYKNKWLIYPLVRFKNSPLVQRSINKLRKN